MTKDNDTKTNQEIIFHNYHFGHPLDFDGLIGAIISYVNERPQAHYRITVGTDSSSGKKVRFITAVTILRVGNGGRYFWTRSNEIFCPTLQDRISKEAIQSITLTQELRSRLKDRCGEDFFWDGNIAIHLDIGENGTTRELVDSMVGMVRGYGFEASIKPESFCASVVADRHTG